MIQVMLRAAIGALAFSLISACASAPPRALAPTQPAAVDRSQADVETAMRKRGYKPASFRGERVYCRNETLTGSNLESKVCLTAEQIEAQERAGKDILIGNRPAGHPAGCVPNTGCD
jgi:hypothetical protein